MAGVHGAAGAATVARKKNAGGGGGATNTPSFVAAGTSVPGIGSGTIAPGYPGSLAAGDLFILHAQIFQEVAPPTPPAGWTAAPSSPFTDGSCKVYVWTCDTRATGSESGTVNVGVNSTASEVRMSAWRDVATSSFIESANTQGGNETTCTGPSLTAGGNARLGVLFLSTVGAGSAGAVSGNSGGTWNERYETNFGNMILQCQDIDFSSGGSCSGGTTSYSGGFGDLGAAQLAFCLIGT